MNNVDLLDLACLLFPSGAVVYMYGERRGKGSRRETLAAFLAELGYDPEARRVCVYAFNYCRH
jgi:hypothetical protein